MAFAGMDPALARTQAAQLDQQGTQIIQNAINSAESLVTQIASNWKGADATRFEQEWQGHLRQQLVAVHQALESFHQVFNNNILEQEHASR